MATLFSALLQLGELLKWSRRGTATGGSTTTLIDANQLDEPPDWFNGGTLFFLSGDNVNTTTVITNYVASSGTFSFAALANAVAAGVQYSAVRGIFTRAAMVSGINQALADLGPVPMTTIFTPPATNQESYTLTNIARIRRVEYSNQAAAPYGWKRTRHWQEIGGDLIFDTGHVPNAASFRIWHEGIHATVTDDADEITNAIDPARLAWAAAFYCALTRMQRVDKTEPWTGEFLQLAGSMKNEMTVRYPIQRIPKDIRVASW